MNKHTPLIFEQSKSERKGYKIDSGTINKLAYRFLHIISI